MNTKKKTFQDDEVDLKKIISALVREKFLILIITLILTAASYVLSVSQAKFYKTTIKIPNNLISEFEICELYFSIQLNCIIVEKLDKYVNNEFKSKLFLSDNLIKFAKQYNQLNEFKSYLETKNINIENYIKNKLELNEKIIIKKKNIKDQIFTEYFLIFENPFPAQVFLNDYIVYSKQIAKSMFLKKITDNISNLITIYKNNLEIAKYSNIIDPVPNVYNRGDFHSLFFLGEKVLSQQIQFLEHSLNQVQKISFNYNYIVSEASEPILISKSNFVFIFFGFVTGIFISFFCILAKTLFKKEY
jgi:LPS O-antigen subunit length determinant protein (WzzB/FepE family)